MSKQQLVRISIPEKAGHPLSKPQKEFNRLTEKISELEKEIEAFRQTTSHIQARMVAEYLPLLRKYNLLRAELVRVFDRAHDRPDTTTSEKKKLADLILAIAFELIDQHGLDDLKAIYDKYDSDGFDTTTAGDHSLPDTPDEAAQMLPDSRSDAFADSRLPMESGGAFMPATQEKAVEKSRIKTGNRKDKPTTARQQAREAKKQLEARAITKTVRMLYMDLVKTFHPDREADEAEKVRKTGIMQRVTEAYETGDLLALLRLQLEFERIGQADLKNLADEPLMHYNKILRQQVGELEQELAGLHQYLAAISGRAAMPANQATGLEYQLNTDLNTLRKSSKILKNDLKILADSAQMKAFLKTYRMA
ncbi:hypothetical protein [Arsenicibacter rosenii]|uniref:Molecular chaperone DnaJ n=1 Tax=Arsenicibacter rosenii TaxID=1750698 RepID=A0A1S2VAS5_9BACT|nr:hypothetical protein [Arsenicibacter rosenii]OIN55792.1 hypothetical protein BLX24_28115 [Arsenicibacter rosenii]